VQSNATTLSGAGYEPGPTVTSTPSRPCSTGVTCAGSNRANGTASAARRCCDCCDSAQPPHRPPDAGRTGRRAPR